MTHAFVAIGADTRPRVDVAEGFEPDEGNAPVAALGRDERDIKWDSRPASTFGAEMNAASKITSCRMKSASRTMRAHRREEIDERRNTWADTVMAA
eukprot:2950139-Pleurochrysis_carterae.AAC.1